VERLRLNPLFRVHTVSAAIFGRLSVGYSTFKAEFLTELAEKHDVEDALFLVDDADDLIGGLRRKNYSYRVEQHGFRNSIERVFREVERRTSSFSVLVTLIRRPRKRGYKPTPSGGIMLKLTRRPLALNAKIRTQEWLQRL